MGWVGGWMSSRWKSTSVCSSLYLYLLVRFVFETCTVYAGGFRSSRAYMDCREIRHLSSMLLISWLCETFSHLYKVCLPSSAARSLTNSLALLSAARPPQKLLQASIALVFVHCPPFLIFIGAWRLILSGPCSSQAGKQSLQFVPVA